VLPRPPAADPTPVAVPLISTPLEWSWRLPTWVRLFTLALAAVPAIRYQERNSMVGLLLVALVWAAATLAERRGLALAVLAEATVSAIVVAVMIQRSEALMVTLVAPPLIAALHRGARLLVPVLAIEVVISAYAVLAAVPPVPEERLFALTTWGLGALGLGLIGTFLSGSASPPEPDELGPYRDAQRLLRQLLHLSDNLSSGLDASSLGGVVGSAVRDRLPTSWMAVYVPRGDDLVPLLTEGEEHHVDATLVEQLAMESWARATTLLEGDHFAFPLGQKVAIGGAVQGSAGLSRVEVERRIDLLQRALRLPSVQLDTALLFADFRASATADLRRHLAREMHDGVAQDIASLGYLVDALAARPASPQQAAQLAMLRDRITAVVAEVRQAVLTLRTSVGESDSLGTAIGNVARHLSDVSSVPITVSLDERPTRLRAEVEAELFRIAQEAMNNAVKHARATQVEVHCHVHAPDATITIRDDGRGLQPARPDSHGLKIMRERARLVGAELELTDDPRGGLLVSVVVGARRPSPVARAVGTAPAADEAGSSGPAEPDDPAGRPTAPRPTPTPHEPTKVTS